MLTQVNFKLYPKLVNFLSKQVEGPSFLFATVPSESFLLWMGVLVCPFEVQVKLKKTRGGFNNINVKFMLKLVDFEVWPRIPERVPTFMSSLETSV